MEHTVVVRILNPKHYDRTKQRFTSLAFRPKDGTLSVVNKQCVLNSGTTVCEHIEKFYGNVAGKPPVFWEFLYEQLPFDCEIAQRTEENGDECHYNLEGVDRKQAEDFFKTYRLENFLICPAPRPLTLADMNSGSQ